MTVVNPLEDSLWDSRWDTSPSWSVFHTAGWASVLSRTYGFQPAYLHLRTPSGGSYLLPFMEAATFGLFRRGVSLPFTDHCPPLVHRQGDEFVADVLKEAALTLGRDRGWRYVEFRGGNIGAGQGLGSLDYYEHTLDLTGSEDALFEGVKSEARTGVRKAAKSGVRIRSASGLDAVRAFYELHVATRARHHLPPQPFCFFEALQEQLLSREAGVVFLAEVEGRPVAGAVFLYTGGSAVYKFGASDLAWQQMRPSNLLIWEAICWLKQHGIRHLSFGRTSLQNEGLRRFKRAWGVAEHGLSYVRLRTHDGSLMESGDQSTGVVPSLLRVLPAPLLRGIGERFYKHIG